MFNTWDVFDWDEGKHIDNTRQIQTKNKMERR